jgi:hypothetical protein
MTGEQLNLTKVEGSFCGLIKANIPADIYKKNHESSARIANIQSEIEILCYEVIRSEF